MKQTRKDPVNFSYYLVAYVDILNQGEVLKQLKGIPTTEDGKQEFIRVLKKTFGAVDIFRQIFEKYFSESQRESSAPSALSEEQRKTFDALVPFTRYTWRSAATSRVVATWKMNTAFASPCASR